MNWYFVDLRTAIALRGSDGVVFAVEKLVTSKLHEDGTGKRLFSIENHIGMVIIVIYFRDNPLKIMF